MNLSQPPAGIAVYTAQAIRDVELRFAEENEQGTYPLMEKAGLAAFETLVEYWPDAKKLLILTGKGNNGGDGYIVAHLALKAGLQPTLCNFCDLDKIQGDALTAYQALESLELPHLSWGQVDLSQYDLVVDAMLGTGIKGAVREPFIDPIESINNSSIPVLSIDIPSGLNADTGDVVNCALIADVTVTYIGYKQGLYTGDAADYRGETRLADLDVDSAFFVESAEQVFVHNWQTTKNKLAPRLPSSHKGANGHCQIIGGAEGMTGAAMLASTASARSGAGLTSTWLEEGALALVATHPEIMARNVAEHEIIAMTNALSPQKVMVIGPGLGSEVWGQNWMAALMQSPIFIDMRKVIDADAINWLARHPAHNDNWILTPHPGEAARLLAKNTLEINTDRYHACREIARQYGGVCVLKGAGTIVADESGNTLVCPVGNPGMGSGGMGDVLSGIIGGLLAQGLSLFDAATLGVCIHGEAANRAVGEKNYFRGLLAGDLFAHIPALVNPEPEKSDKISAN